MTATLSPMAASSAVASACVLPTRSPGTVRGLGPSDTTSGMAVVFGTSAPAVTPSPSAMTVPLSTFSSKVLVTSPRVSPAAVSSLLAASRVWPTRSVGIGTGGGPVDTRILSSPPWAMVAPAAGSCSRICPGTVPSWAIDAWVTVKPSPSPPTAAATAASRSATFVPTSAGAT